MGNSFIFFCVVVVLLLVVGSIVSDVCGGIGSQCNGFPGKIVGDGRGI